MELNVHNKDNFPTIRSILSFDFYDNPDYIENNDGRVRIRGLFSSLQSVLGKIDSRHFEIICFKPESRLNDYYFNGCTFSLSKEEMRSRINDATPSELTDLIAPKLISAHVLSESHPKKKVKQKNIKKTKIRTDDGFRPVPSPYGSVKDDKNISSPPKKELDESGIFDGELPEKEHRETDHY